MGSCPRNKVIVVKLSPSTASNPSTCRRRYPHSLLNSQGNPPYAIRDNAQASGEGSGVSKGVRDTESKV